MVIYRDIVVSLELRHEAAMVLRVPQDVRAVLDQEPASLGALAIVTMRLYWTSSEETLLVGNRAVDRVGEGATSHAVDAPMC